MTSTLADDRSARRLRRSRDRIPASIAALFVAGCAHAPARDSARAREVVVAAVQCSSTFGDVEGNRRKLTALVEEAAAHGAKIVVLPEAAITGYLSQDLRTTWRLEGWPIDAAFTGKDPLPFAEPVPGPSTRHFADLAKRLGIYVTIPFVEIDDPGRGATERRFFNTVCLASPMGEIVAHYRKLTPWPVPEQSWATPGDRGIQCVDTEFGRVGLAICYDVHTILDRYDDSKLWALLYPIAWVDDAHPTEWFGRELPSRVARHRIWLVGANWSVDGPEPWFGYGFSEIVSPRGEV
ncbi:MAG: carbon-nitrogen hydrolase family protein, partial [Planctomycetes bacterium]|nr:carbon-nitrogen hydrolase family protein [Planctomycetota bacterium]